MHFAFTDTRLSAAFTHAGLPHFGDLRGEAAAAETGDIVVPLMRSALVGARGADTESFLQGQISNDIRLLDEARSLPAAYSSAKGRMLAALHLSRGEDGVWIELDQSIATATLKRLRLYVLRAKVVLEEVSTIWPALGLSGPGAAGHLAALGLPHPETVHTAARADGVQVIRRAGRIPRFSLRATPGKLAGLWEALAKRARPAGTEAWRLLDILAGVATICPGTQDHFVAQMANLDLMGGISFDKGCYTGQEVIARLHYLGHLKRRMFLLRTDAPPPVPGTAVHAAGEAQSVGEVVDAAAAAADCALAAVLKREYAGSTRLHLGSIAGAALSRPARFAPGLPPD